MQFTTSSVVRCSDVTEVSISLGGYEDWDAAAGDMGSSKVPRNAADIELSSIGGGGGGRDVTWLFFNEAETLLNMDAVRPVFFRLICACLRLLSLNVGGVGGQ